MIPSQVWEVSTSNRQPKEAPMVIRCGRAVVCFRLNILNQTEIRPSVCGGGSWRSAISGTRIWRKSGHWVNSHEHKDGWCKGNAKPTRGS